MRESVKYGIIQFEYIQGRLFRVQKGNPELKQKNFWTTIWTNLNETKQELASINPYSRIALKAIHLILRNGAEWISFNINQELSLSHLRVINVKIPL